MAGGRPPGNGLYEVKTTLLLSPKMKAEVESAARAVETSSSEWIRRVIRQELLRGS